MKELPNSPEGNDLLREASQLSAEQQSTQCKWLTAHPRHRELWPTLHL